MSLIWMMTAGRNMWTNTITDRWPISFPSWYVYRHSEMWSKRCTRFWLLQNNGWHILYCCDSQQLHSKYPFSLRNCRLLWRGQCKTLDQPNAVSGRLNSPVFTRFSNTSKSSLAQLSLNISLREYLLCVGTQDLQNSLNSRMSGPWTVWLRQIQRQIWHVQCDGHWGACDI